MGTISRHRGGLVLVVLALGPVLGGCARQTSSAELVAYKQMEADNQGAMMRAEVLSPNAYARSQIYFDRAEKACGQGEQADCDRYAALARLELATALEHSRWFERMPPELQGNTVGLPLTAAETSKLDHLRDHELLRLRMLRSLREEQTKEAHRALLDRMIARRGQQLQRIDAAKKFLVVAVQQQQQQRRRERQQRHQRQQRRLVRELNAAYGAQRVKQLPDGVAVIFRNLFRPNSARLAPRRARALATVARLAQRHKDYRMVVEGHTDGAGRSTVNEELSARRAQAVRDHLLSQGVEEDQVISVGFGNVRPVASNATASGRGRNRRISCIFLFP